jgi:hypothetical protein
MPDAMGTEPMFAIPEVYRAPKRKDLTVTKWGKHHGRPVTCDLCIMNLHDGISDTQLTHAKHTLTRGERKWLLCSVHAAQVKNGERKLSG